MGGPRGNARSLLSREGTTRRATFRGGARPGRVLRAAREDARADGLVSHANGRGADRR